MEMAGRGLDRDQLVIFFWLFCEVTVLSLVGVVLWLSLTPKKPHFTVAGARFPPPNPADAAVAAIVVGLQIFNPNDHMGIDYRGIDFKLCAAGSVVGVNSAPGFYQGYKNTTLLQMAVQTSRESWRHAVNGSDVDFMIRVEAAFRFRIFKWRTKIHHFVREARISQ